MPFHLLLGSTSRYLPALAYASDRHVTDVISVMSCQSRDMSAMCLSYRSVTSKHSQEFHRDYIITIVNPDDITNNYIILPILCRALIYY